MHVGLLYVRCRTPSRFTEVLTVLREIASDQPYIKCQKAMSDRHAQTNTTLSTFLTEINLFMHIPIYRSQTHLHVYSVTHSIIVTYYRWHSEGGPFVNC